MTPPDAPYTNPHAAECLDDAAWYAGQATELLYRVTLLFASERAIDTELAAPAYELAAKYAATAGLLLAMGGHGTNEQAHRELGLPYMGTRVAHGA